MKTTNISPLFLVIISAAIALPPNYPVAKCGQTTYTKFGTITSPPSENCEWRIVASPDEKITLTVTNLTIEKTQNCKSGYVELRDGAWSNSPSLGRFCGEGSLDPITSTGNNMLIAYKATSGVFLANYESIRNEDLYVVNETIVKSIDYPEKYPLSKKCQWRITTPETSQAIVSFKHFDLETGENCSHDYVEIRDGFTDESNLIGVYCGTSTPDEIISSTNMIQLVFVSDATVQGNGFFAIATHTNYNHCVSSNHGCAHHCVKTERSYKCVCNDGYELDSNGRDCKVPCGGTLNATMSTITSPKFPENYPLRQSCVWEIADPPEDRILKLQFNYFDLETSSSNCSFDSLEVFTPKTKSRGVYCGRHNPDPIISKSGMKITFKSDDSVARTGFSIDVKSDLDGCAINNGNCRHGCINTLQSTECICYGYGSTLLNGGRDCHNGCHHEISSIAGEIKSPNFPNAYPNMALCGWLFTTTPGHRIHVSFNSFLMEAGKNCPYDKVEFYDGPSNKNKTLATFCGSTTPPAINSTSNELYMFFKSDGSNVYRGFRANYSSVCGGVLQAGVKEKYIYSHPNYATHDYANQTLCEWTIKSTSGYHTKLSFSSFAVEMASNCTYDYVQVFKGLNSEAPSAGKFCGYQIPNDLLGLDFFVLFRTDGSQSKKGFVLKYEAVPNVTIY